MDLELAHVYPSLLNLITVGLMASIFIALAKYGSARLRDSLPGMGALADFFAGI